MLSAITTVRQGPYRLLENMAEEQKQTVVTHKRFTLAFGVAGGAIKKAPTHVDAFYRMKQFVLMEMIQFFVVVLILGLLSYSQNLPFTQDSVSFDSVQFA